MTAAHTNRAAFGSPAEARGRCASLFRNRELHAFSLRFLAAALALFALFYALRLWELREIAQRVTAQNAAVAGALLSSHPEWESDVVSALTAAPAAADVQRGYDALARFGYKPSTPLREHPVLRQIATGDALMSALFFLLCAAAFLFIALAGFSSVFQRVRDVSAAAERVMDGRFAQPLPADGEGDFAILGHRFNQMAKRLELTLEQLRGEKKFLRDIISDISHQLKTPLSTLLVYNELMLADPAMDVQSRTKFLSSGHGQLTRLEWLIQSLLKMARLEAGSVIFRSEPVSLREVVNRAIASLEPLCAESGVRCTVPPGEAVITGDGDWLVEALTNVLKNGIEHSDRGGEVVVRIDQTPLFASVEVTDSGEGIDEADLPHVFERFYRSTRAVKPNSIGIGLALSRAIVEGQGGSIAVRSQRGLGSAFTISFLRTLGK